MTPNECMSPELCNAVHDCYSLQGNALSLSCPDDQRVNMEVDGVDTTFVTCSIGNPLRGPGSTLRVATTFNLQANLVGNEDDISIGFSVQSVNVEAPGNDVNNMAGGSVQFNAIADITLDPVG